MNSSLGSAFSVKAVRISLISLVALTGIAAAGVFATQAYAISSTAVVYNSIPDTLAPNYPSQPFQAQQTAEFGDFVHLAGTDRGLQTVTVTMSNWALASTPANVTFCAADAANCDATGYFWPITVNVYSSHLNGSGVPDQLLATKTVTQHIPWRPEADGCGGSSTAYTGSDSNCYNGSVSNVTFDLSSLNVTLPDNVIVGFVYNTQTYGPAPTGVDGPYNSLNIAVPDNDPVTAGTDDNASEVFWNTSTAGWYADHGASGVGTFRKDTNWSPNGTVAMKITATTPPDTTPPSVPTLLAPSNGSATTTNDFYFDWNASTDNSGGPVTYQFHSSQNPAESSGVLTTGLWTSPAPLTSPTIHSTGAPSGAWYWQVRAQDAAGNWSDWSDIWSMVIVPSCGTGAGSFDTFALGSVNGQSGWKATGAYDQAVSLNSRGFASFGCKSLRISNAVTSGAFGDQTFSASTSAPAGETGNNHYVAQFDITTTQLAEQPGLAISVSPDDGNGSRMSYLSFTDTPSGIDVVFYDVQGTGNPANFVSTDLGTISRTAPHTIKFDLTFIPGANNDVAKIYIDGVLVHTGTTWENYYRYDSEQAGNGNQLFPISRLLFRAGGTAAPAVNGKGYLVDNVSLSTDTLPNVTTDPASAITTTNATLNATVGPSAASEMSFWVSTSTFSTASTHMPSGVYSTPVLAGVSGGVSFSDPLSIVTTNGIIWDGSSNQNVNMPAITASTTYYYVAWANVGGTWYHGDVKSFTTAAPPDTTKPVIHYHYPASGAFASSTLKVSVTVTDAESGLENINIHLFDSTGTIPGPSCGNALHLGGVHSYTENCTVDTTLVADGPRTVYTDSFDRAGNFKKNVRPIIVDNTKPTVTMANPADNSTQAGSFTASGTASDATSGMDRVEYTITKITALGGTYVSTVGSGTATFATSTGAWSFGVTGLGDGFYRVKVQAFDQAGNWKYLYHDVQVVNVVPALTITMPASNGDTATSTYAFKAQYDNGVTTSLQWAVRTGANASCSGGTTVAGNVDGHHDASALSGSLFSTTLDTTAWADGAYCFVINDGHGLRPVRLFSVDNNGPIAPTLVSPADGATVSGASVTQSWSDSDTGIDHFLYQSWHDLAMTSLRFAATYASTTFSKTATNVATSTYYWRVGAVDGVGNTSWSGLWQLNIGTPPAPPLTYTYATTTVKAADLAASPADVVSNPSKWFFYSDTTDTIDNALGSFVTGPSTAPLGDGSAEMTLDASPADRLALATYQFSGVPLKDITQMQYSVFELSNAGAAPMLQFNVDLNGTDTWQKRLLYEPSGNGQQALFLGSWNTIDAYQNQQALWTWSGLVGHGGSATQWPDGSTAEYRTWDDITMHFPNARVRVTDSWLGFRIGSPGPSGYTANVDKFVIGLNDGTNATTTTFDFEPTPAAPTTFGGGAGGSAAIDVGRGSVLGAAIGPTGSTTPSTSSTTPTTTPMFGNGKCTPDALFLTSYIKLGAKNDAGQVKLLQQFLNSDQGATLPVTGFYGPLSFAAVKAFQTKYAEQILAPWTAAGFPQKDATGYVYKTTLRWINTLYCGLASDTLPLDIP